MVGCYTIFSKKLNRFYVGVIQDDLIQRIIKHNENYYGANRFDAKADEWELFLMIYDKTFNSVLAIEKHNKDEEFGVY